MSGIEVGTSVEGWCLGEKLRLQNLMLFSERKGLV